MEIRKLQMALDICGNFEKKLEITGRDTGATGAEYAEYLMKTLSQDNLEEVFNSYQK